MALQKSSPRIQFIEPIKSPHKANTTADSIVSPCHQSTSAISPLHNSPTFPIATLGKHVIFHPIVRIIPANGQSDEDLKSPSSHPRSPTNWSDFKQQRRMRLGTKTLSLPLCLSPNRPHTVKFWSPTASDFHDIAHSRQSVLARTQREIEEDAQFIPSPVRTIKLTIPSLTRRPSSKTLRRQEEDRIRRCQEARGGQIKSCLKQLSLCSGPTPSVPRTRLDSNQVGIAISTNTMRNLVLSSSPQPDIIVENASPTDQLHWNQAVEDTPVFTSSVHSSPASSSDSVGPNSPLGTNEDTESDQSSPESMGHTEDSSQFPIRGLNRLTKKFSDSALHFRLFTPKPQRRQLPVPVAGHTLDEMEELEVSSPEPEPITSNTTSRSWLPVLSLRKRASNIEPRSKVIGRDNDSCRQDSTGQSTALGNDSLAIDDPMKDRLPVRSQSYHHDSRGLPSTSDDLIFNTDPYGESTCASLPALSPGISRSKTTSYRTLTALEQGLRPCCETCEEAASKGLQADHEIRFSPKALEIYRSRAWYLEDIVIEDAKKVNIGDPTVVENHSPVVPRPPLPNRIRTLRCSIHKRDVSLDQSGELIIPSSPPIPNTSTVTDILPVEKNNNLMTSPRPKLYEYHLNQTVGLGVQYESGKVRSFHSSNDQSL